MKTIQAMYGIGVALLCGFAGQAAAQVKIGGSDLFAGLLTADGAPIVLQFAGSYAGKMDLEAGRVDAAILAVADDRPPAGEWLAVPFAYQVVSVVVHNSNPLEAVSYLQLGDLFREGGRATTWGDVMDNETWRVRKVSLAAIRQQQSLALEIFISQVLGDAPTRSTVNYYRDAAQLQRAILQDTNSIALLPGLQEQGDVKVVSVSKDAGSQAYGPTPDNVKFGDYPLRLPFYVVFRADLEPAKRDVLVDWIMSDAVTDALESAYYLPLSDVERERYRDELRSQMP